MHEIDEFLKKNRVTEIEAIIPDMAGIARGKIIPRSKFESGESMRLPQAVMIQTVTGDYPEDGTLTGVTDPDMVCVPDASTIRMIPWAVDPTALDRWLLQLSHTRPAAERLDYALSAAQLLGAPPPDPLDLAQLPVTANDRWLGLPLDDNSLSAALRKMRFDVEGVRSEERGASKSTALAPRSSLLVTYPPYRTDIRHMVDLFEDVAIGFGYANIEPKLVRSMTVGAPRPEEVKQQAPSSGRRRAAELRQPPAQALGEVGQHHLRDVLGVGVLELAATPAIHLPAIALDELAQDMHTQRDAPAHLIASAEMELRRTRAQLRASAWTLLASIAEASLISMVSSKWRPTSIKTIGKPLLRPHGRVKAG